MDWKYAVFFALLLAIPLVSAASAQATDVKGQLINSALEDVKCRNDFTSGYVSALLSLPNATDTTGMQTAASALGNDYTQLQGYIASGDGKGFRSYIKETYDPDVRKVNDAIRAWRKSANITKDMRASINTTYYQLKATYDSCRLTAIKDQANARVAWYNDILNIEQERAANLSAKGVDTSRISTIISDAQNEIITPLQSSINSATDVREVVDALHSYCLYNGCENGTNFHFAAKIGIERLNEVLSRIQASNRSANFSTQISAAQTDLANASSALAKIGTAAYGSQHDSVWDPIKDAGMQIKEILAGMRSQERGNGRRGK